MHHTKVKGDLGVLKAQLDLFEQGFMVLSPMTEHAPFDLVAYKDKEFKRIQVKYKSVDRAGGITVHFRSCWADENGAHMQLSIKEKLIFIATIARIQIVAITLTLLSFIGQSR